MLPITLVRSKFAGELFLKHPYTILSMLKLSPGFDLNTHIIFKLISDGGKIS